MIRPEVNDLLALGTMPNESRLDAMPEEQSIQLVADFQTRLERVPRPISDEEACAMMALLEGVKNGDTCYGLVEGVISLLETAPGWPIGSCLTDRRNYWVRDLRQRMCNAGHTEYCDDKIAAVIDEVVSDMKERPKRR